LNPAIATTAFVLDNSLLCGWFLANQATPYSDAVAGLLPVVDAHPPWLLQLEFTNVLRTDVPSCCYAAYVHQCF
jgi:hypothetical protein